ncbi:hypothetical protein Tco_0643956 [Tanacetum coccineum]
MDPCFINGLEAYDGEINLGVEENMISNEYAVKLCLEHEVKKGNKVVKKELIVALRAAVVYGHEFYRWIGPAAAILFAVYAAIEMMMMTMGKLPVVAETLTRRKLCNFFGSSPNDLLELTSVVLGTRLS